MMEPNVQKVSLSTCSSVGWLQDDYTWKLGRCDTLCSAVALVRSDMLMQTRLATKLLLLGPSIGFERSYYPQPGLTGFVADGMQSQRVVVLSHPTVQSQDLP
jgi:hypothetical protein